MTHKELALLESLYYRVIVLENILLHRHMVTEEELIEAYKQVQCTLKEQDAAKIPTQTVTGWNGQSDVHPPNEPPRKKRRR